MGNVHIPDTWTCSPLCPMQFIEHITTRGNNLFIANERFFIDSHSFSLHNLPPGQEKIKEICLDDLRNTNPTIGSNCGGLDHYDLQMLCINYRPLQALVLIRFYAGFAQVPCHILSRVCCHILSRVCSIPLDMSYTFLSICTWFQTLSTPLDTSYTFLSVCTWFQTILIGQAGHFDTHIDPWSQFLVRSPS